MNYYNDNDPKAAAWLRELIKQNIIPPGDVDERSIEDVTKSDLQGYTQCHFFAGIGGWSEALRLAEWPTDRPVWTGSCPCQPFSSAGKQKGTKDPRHLWPEFYRLIAECKPNIIFGEQVERAVGMGWLDGVFADLEAEGYTCGAAVLGAHSVNAPHIRQRAYWVADSSSDRRERARAAGEIQEGRQQKSEFNRELPDGSEGCGIVNRVADSEHQQHQGSLSRRCQKHSPDGSGATSESTGCGEIGRMGDSNCSRFSKYSGEITVQTKQPAAELRSDTGSWSNSVWIPCADGKARRIEPESFPLAHGIPGRVGLLRGYGNAIVPQVAAEFIKAYEECVK